MGKKKASERSKARISTGSNRNSQLSNGGANTDGGTAMTTTTTTTTTAPKLTPTTITVPAADTNLTDDDRNELKRQMYQLYGGVSLYDIGPGLQHRTLSNLAALPPYVNEALQVYTTCKKYQYIVSNFPVDDHIRCLRMNKLPAKPGLIKLEQQKLQDLYTKHGMSDRDMHNFFQETRWDAYAYYYAAQSLLNPEPSKNNPRVVKACSYIVDAMTSMEDDATDVANRRCLDIGCGIGDAISALTTLSSVTGAFIEPSQIHGIDISGETIKYAKELYPQSHFIHGDFSQYDPKSSGDHTTNANSERRETGSDDEYFDGIIFSSSLPYMSNTYQVLEHAISILRPNGRGIIVLSQTTGAGPVQRIHHVEPNIVAQLCPTAQELRTFVEEYNTKQVNQIADTTIAAMSNNLVRLLVEPADPDSAQDELEGYLAVLRKG
jgi:ubiquinone/menaquinone biosynthesis C-methylase UbiE